jgi:hypothetical protein
VSTPRPPETPAPGRNLHQTFDPQLGLVLCALELPPGWSAQSQVEWRPDWPSNPVSSWARVSDPTNTVGVDFLPAQSFAWIEPNPGMYPAGTMLAGQVMLQPAPAAVVLSRWLIPRMRGPQARVTSVQTGRELARRMSIVDQPGARLDGASAIVEVPGYTEEWYGLTVYADAPPEYGPLGPLVQTNWGFERLLVMHAPTGTLDAHREQLWSIAGGLRVNPVWQEQATQTVLSIQRGLQLQMAQGYANIAAAGQLSRQISANNNAMIAGMDASRAAANAADANRRRAELADPGRGATAGFDEYIRGVNTYDDPEYGSSQHDATAAYVWTDGSGTYQYSDDPFFNPNIGAGGGPNWSVMTPTVP